MRRSSGVHLDQDQYYILRSYDEPVKKICTYCDKHRRSETSSPPPSFRKRYVRHLSTGSGRKQRRLEDMKSDEIIASELRPENSPCTRKSSDHLIKSASGEGGTDLTRVLHSSGEKKKRVNFVRRTSSSSSSSSSENDEEDDKTPDYFEASNSSSYYEPRQYESFKRRSESRSSSTNSKESSSDHWSSGFEKLHRGVIRSKIDPCLRRLLERNPPPTRLAGGHDAAVKSNLGSCINQPGGCKSILRRRRQQSDSDHHLVEEGLSNLSLASSAARSSLENRPRWRPAEPEPRIVKPRDAMRRAAVKKMLVYPPEGQSGEPLTLYKKWSNIDCHVTGDREHGLRYTVYYLQKFESRRWRADPKTGGPFRSLEDNGCSTTTDHG